MTEQEIRKLIAQEISNHFPVGMIFAFPAEAIPENFLPCEGQELPKKQYPALFALIGNSFGGAGTTFCLPDLQGQFIRGLDREGNLDMEENGDLRRLGSIQEDAFQGHQHTLKTDSDTTAGSGSHQHEMYKEEHGGGMGTIFYSVNHNGYANSESCKKGKVNIPSSGYHWHSLPKMDVLDATNSSYGEIRVSSETRPTNVALIFCIKVK